MVVHPVGSVIVPIIPDVEGLRWLRDLAYCTGAAGLLRAPHDVMTLWRYGAMIIWGYRAMSHRQT
jgi:hypothetical protein